MKWTAQGLRESIGGVLVTDFGLRSLRLDESDQEAFTSPV